MKRKLMPLDVAQKQGWRVLAGPFAEGRDVACGRQLLNEPELAERVIQHIEKEGGRCALVQRAGGITEIWRPASEMETVEATALRLRKQALNN